MKFRFMLEEYTEKDGVISTTYSKHKTLQDVADKLGIPYHQARSLLLIEEKQFSHKHIKNLSKLYRIYSIKYDDL